MSYACIFVLDFPAQAILRAEPELRDYALAVLDGHPPLERLVSMNDFARRRGVRMDMPRTVLEQCPSLLLRPRSPASEAVAHRALLDTARNFSPRVEDTAWDTVILDLAGMEQVFGPPEKLAAELARRIKETGLAARVAAASNPDAALAVARGRAGVNVIPPGREAEMLGPLPLSVLRPPAEMLETLERWGIRDFAGLAALPTAELSERLGQPGVHLQALARGTFRRPLMGVESEKEFSESLELEYSVRELEPLAFILNRLLVDLCNRLRDHCVVTNEVQLRMELEPPSRDRSICSGDLRSPGVEHSSTLQQERQYEKTIRLPVPTRDAKLLLNLLRIHLETEPLSSPVVKVAFHARPAAPRTAQGGLFAPLAPDPQKLEVTLARIAGLVGWDNVGSPRLLDTHRPGAFEMRRFELPPEKEKESQVESNGRVALRLYRPPPAAAVRLRNETPAHVSFCGVSGPVVTAAGPWRTSGCWWQSAAWKYDEWDVELETRKAPGFYRLYFDFALDTWFVRGEYD